MQSLRSATRQLQEIFPYKNIMVLDDEIVVQWDITRLKGELIECVPYEDTYLYGVSATSMCYSILNQIRRNKDKLPRELRNLPVTVRGI